MELFDGTHRRKKQKTINAELQSNDQRQRAIAAALPVHSCKAQLLRSINHDVHRVLLVTAATGSGKSTQIPQYLLNSTHMVVVTQPRRVAAITLAHRVALEHGSKEQNASKNNHRVGQQVGYRIRFEDMTSSNTQLVYATDGMLLRECLVDRSLSKYSVVMLDEAHERSIATDLLLGICKEARQKRANTSRPLKLVIMSATLQVDVLMNYFGGSTQVDHIDIPGKQHPVQVLYTAKTAEDYHEAALATILQVHEHEAAGDVLVFLPGQEEIESMAQLLQTYLDDADAASQWTGDKVVNLQQQNFAGSRGPFA